MCFVEGQDVSPTLPIEISSNWLVEWGLVTITANTMPPRDPNDDEDEDEADQEEEERQDDPAVVREPDPDE